MISIIYLAAVDVQEHNKQQVARPENVIIGNFDLYPLYQTRQDLLNKVGGFNQQDFPFTLRLTASMNNDSTQRALISRLLWDCSDVTRANRIINGFSQFALAVGDPGNGDGTITFGNENSILCFLVSLQSSALLASVRGKAGARHCCDIKLGREEQFFHVVRIGLF